MTQIIGDSPHSQKSRHHKALQLFAGFLAINHANCFKQSILLCQHNFPLGKQSGIA